jgi:hypothetical protein
MKKAVSQNRRPNLMVKMVADKLDILSGFMRNRIINNEYFFLERNVFTKSYDLMGQKTNKFTPIEPFMVQESIVGIFFRIDLVLKTLTVPKTH